MLDRLALRSSDRTLIVFNPGLARIAAALAEAARAGGCAVRVILFPSGTRHGQEPPDHVADGMRDADVIIAPTAYSLTHTDACLEARRLGARVATMPGITEETFRRAIPADYAALERRSNRLARRLTEATQGRLTTPIGTDLELLLQGRQGRANDGDLRAAGAVGNLPAGEGFIAPIESESRGRVVVDGSLAGWGALAEPLVVAIEGGRVVGASGDAALWLLDTLDAGGPNGRVLCELGIGTNPRAQLCGSILEDEKVLGTVHVAFGTNVGFGGASAAQVHVDAVVLAPTLELDGEQVVSPNRISADAFQDL